jgi:hypothetical protein
MLELLKRIAAAAAEEAIALVVEALTHLHLRVSTLEAIAARPLSAQDPNVHLHPAFPAGLPPEVLAEVGSLPVLKFVDGFGEVPVCSDHGQPIGNCPPSCRSPKA